MSEGNCSVCGQPLGISDMCWGCQWEKEHPTPKPTGPTCAECGAGMTHFRLRGYECSVNPRHNGIKHPEVTR